jgi:hypothetical protein
MIATVSSNENGKSVLIQSDIESGKTLSEVEISMKVDQMVWSSSKNTLLIKSKDSDETFSVDKSGATKKVLDCLLLANNEKETYAIQGKYNSEGGYLEEINILSV